MQTVADTCLSAGAAAAADLARAEERKLLRLVAELVETQMQKVALKMDHLDRLHDWVELERQQLVGSPPPVELRRVWDCRCFLGVSEGVCVCVWLNCCACMWIGCTASVDYTNGWHRLGDDMG